ncbi:MAG TPA: hypothetical protein VKQ73_09835 [Stellaceae bacterium]|nr:hypothetical protein [Stellaceae bacterium]
MNRGARWLAVAVALAGVAAIGLAAASPAEAHHPGGFGRFGFGYGYGYGYGPRFGVGYPVFYAPPPIYPLYVAPRVAYIPPPPIAYRYRYRRVAVRHIYHHVVHRHWCSCNCCR